MAGLAQRRFDRPAGPQVRQVLLDGGIGFVLSLLPVDHVRNAGGVVEIAFHRDLLLDGNGLGPRRVTREQRQRPLQVPAEEMAVQVHHDDGSEVLGIEPLEQGLSLSGAEVQRGERPEHGLPARIALTQPIVELRGLDDHASLLRIAQLAHVRGSCPAQEVHQQLELVRPEARRRKQIVLAEQELGQRPAVLLEPHVFDLLALLVRQPGEQGSGFLRIDLDTAFEGVAPNDGSQAIDHATHIPLIDWCALDEQRSNGGVAGLALQLTDQCRGADLGSADTERYGGPRCQPPFPAFTHRP